MKKYLFLFLSFCFFFPSLSFAEFQLVNSNGDIIFQGNEGIKIANSNTLPTKTATTGITATANTGGANTAISVVQPYFVVYMWKRTA